MTASGKAHPRDKGKATGASQAHSAALTARRRPVEAADLSLVRAGMGLFLVSAASLAFEVTLTHLYALVFQYHYAFLAISAAILGLGVGAAVGYRLGTGSGSPVCAAWLSRTAGIYALALPGVILLFTLTGLMPGLAWQVVLGALPYTVAGLLTARLYTLFPGRAAWLYAFDLAGAAVGLLGILTLLSLVSPASAGMLLGLLAGAGALAFGLSPGAGSHFHPTWACAALAVAALGLGLNLATRFADLPVLFDSAAADKTMFQVLGDASQQPKLVDSAWSSFARADLVSTQDPDLRYVFTNAGAGSYMLRYDGSLETVNWLAGQVEYLPFLDFHPQETLVLGAGAGKDVLQALLAGSSRITAVEINPAMVAITRKYAGYNGGVLDLPGVQTVVADGRAFVERSAASYDMIYMNLVYAQAPAPGSSALSEAYMFTTQAFQAYWRRLAEGGRLAIVSHQGLEGTRALITAIRALNLEGLSAPEALKRSALLMYTAEDPNQNTSVLILQKKPLTAEQVDLLQKTAAAEGMQPLFLPGAFESLFAGLVDGQVDLNQFLTQKDYNIFPTTDDRPFFFAITPGIPGPLAALLVIAGLGALLYLAVMAGVKSQPTGWQMVYFGGLGLGYMLIEAPLIQRILLLVGSPTEAMAVVLGALLLAGGLGSYWSGRWPMERLARRLGFVAGLIAALAASLALWQPGLTAGWSRLSPGMRVALSGLSLAPLGFLMGIPFANGLRLAGLRSTGVLPYLWGWNALTSVLGSALAAVLGMQFGFAWGLLAGAACYGIVTLSAVLPNGEAPYA